MSRTAGVGTLVFVSVERTARSSRPFWVDGLIAVVAVGCVGFALYQKRMSGAAIGSMMLANMFGWSLLRSQRPPGGERILLGFTAANMAFAGLSIAAHAMTQDNWVPAAFVGVLNVILFLVALAGRRELAKSVRETFGEEA